MFGVVSPAPISFAKVLQNTTYQSEFLPEREFRNGADYREEDVSSYCRYDEVGEGENITQFFSYDLREEGGLRVNSVRVG